MAAGIHPVTRRDGLAWSTAALLGALPAVAFVALLGGDRALGPALAALLDDPLTWRIVRFTLLQAGLSALLAVLAAIPVALALARLPDGPFKRGVLVVFALPLALPQIVAVLSMLALWGNRGILRGLAETAGLSVPGIYGLGGIVLVHVFFNMPLVARLLHAQLEEIPIEYRRLSAQLGMRGWHGFRLVDWPVLRHALSGGVSLVFLLCVTSFTVVLVLGGGPRATTLEVAVYQALKFDFDPARAAGLALIQIAITISALAAFAWLGRSVSVGESIASSRRRRPPAYAATPWFALAVVAIAAIFVVSPFIAIVERGLAADIARLLGEASVLRAMTTSLVLGVLAALVACLAALALGDAAARTGHRRIPGLVFAHAPASILAVPPLIIAAGWFLVLRHTGDPFAWAAPVVVAVNAAMALPFAARLIAPAVAAMAERQDRLCAQLGLSGWARFRLVSWPVLRLPLAAAFMFAFALSLGDLGVIALFGSEQVQTLPFLILQRMGSYRTVDAAGLALILAAMTALLMYATETIARRAEEQSA